MWQSIWTRTFAASIPAASRSDWLRWLVSAFGLWLLVVTRPLWANPQAFPQVPWFEWGRHVPTWVDAVLLFVVGVSLIVVGCTGSESRWNRPALICSASSLVGLMLLDQHRCQPWAYQLVLTALILALARYDLTVGLLRLLTVSIYFHSAVSKCDWSFCTGTGRSFLMTLQALLTGQNPAANAWENSYWPLLFAVGELLVAVGLIWPASRRYAVWGAAIMHLLLLLILGPWGLNHSNGVLIWNLFFILQNFALFGAGKQELVNQSVESSVAKTEFSRGSRAAIFVTAWAVLWPLAEPWGYCDLWPAWGLYAQHGERLTILVTEPALRRLPAPWQETAVRQFVNEQETGWWLLRPQPVALQRTNAPVYPQNRYLLGVAADLARKSKLPGEQISAIWYSTANRWTGQHSATKLRNLAEIEQAMSKCFWNARPR